jgi:alpha-beta hydrolase superfamily lysophospholipase
MKSTGAADAYKGWQKDLPVLLLSGQEDPVGDFGKGPLQVEKMMKKAGLTSVETEFYLGSRHDILHEEVSGTAEEVRNRIRQWMR